MKKFISNVCKYAIVMVTAIALVIVLGFMDGKSAQVSASSVSSVESGTWCWFGTCGHPGKYVTYYTVDGDRYYVSSEGTDYEYTGKIVYSGNSAEISETTEYSISFSAGIEFGPDVCKGSIGFSGGLTKSYSYTDVLNNNSNYTKYVHSAVEYEKRQSNGVRVKRRTYWPFEHLTAFNEYCEYDNNYSEPSAKIPTGNGYKLLSNKKYCSAINVK